MVVVVEKGDTLREIGRTLAAAGVVASDDAFVDAAAGNSAAQGIAPGAYSLRSGMSGEAAVALMLDPASRVVKKVVVPEGWRFERTVAAAAKGTGLSEDALLESLSRAGSLGLPAYAEGNPEGFLFPATYEFQPGVTSDKVISTMIGRFDQAAESADLEQGARDRKLTPLQLLTVASLVQGESAPEDYDKVARVIYNRLKKGMPLQLDSTVNYALGTSELQLSAEQLATDSPYNTYKNKGLPPGPDQLPGRRCDRGGPQPGIGLVAVLRHHGPEGADHRVRHVVRRLPRAQAQVPGECRLRRPVRPCAARPSWATRSPTRCHRCCTGRPTASSGCPGSTTAST